MQLRRGAGSARKTPAQRGVYQIEVKVIWHGRHIQHLVTGQQHI